MPGAGVSSTIFLMTPLDRAILSKKETISPCWSAKIWIRCGAAASDIFRSTGGSSPKAESASRSRPRKPPAAHQPRFDDPHAFAAAAGGGLDQDRKSIPFAAPARVASPGLRHDIRAGSERRRGSINAFAIALEPITRMASADGPMKRIPASAQAVAKAGFSDRKP